MRSCSGSVLKLVVFLVNLLFVIFSILLMTYGGLVIGNVFDWKKLYHISNAPFIVLIGVGAVLFVLTFFACCGAFMENTCMLMTFSYTVGALVLLQIGAVVVVYRYRSKVEDVVIKEGQNLIYDYDRVPEAKIFIDEMQWNLKCCGFRNVSDWSDWKSEHQQTYPESCCERTVKTCSTPAYKNGCAKPVEEGINANSGILIGVVVAYIAIQFISMVMSCCLVSSIRKDYFQFV